MKTHEIFKHKGEFFRVLETTGKSQLAVMTIEAGSDSGAEGLHKGDQFIYCIEGFGEIEIEKERFKLKAGSAIIIPAGKKHKGYASSSEDFFFVTVYEPPAY